MPFMDVASLGYGQFPSTTLLGAAASSPDFSNLIKQLQSEQEKANLANEQRYQEILKLYDTLGAAGRTRIEQQTKQAQAATTQSLISRGLGATTITESARRGIASEAELQRQTLEESLAAQKAGVMERRADVGPDIGLYASLIQAAAAGAGAGQRTTTTQMGAMAQRGLDVFGQPLGGGGGGASFSQAGLSAGGGAGGGVLPTASIPIRGQEFDPTAAISAAFQPSEEVGAPVEAVQGPGGVTTIQNVQRKWADLSSSEQRYYQMLYGEAARGRFG